MIAFAQVSPELAALAGLRYVSDQAPGIRRYRAGRGFCYRDAEDRLVRDRAIIERIRGLVIPPAWHDVWICAAQTGHLQATGRDARGRKQYRYHDLWRKVCDETKFARLPHFARSLPAIRRAIDRDLQLPGLPRPKVLAAVVHLLETTLIRVGNDEYARANGSFGLTTLRTRHATIEKGTLRFEFRGKSGVQHCVELDDPRVARTVRACRDLPGHELFQYVDEAGQRQAIDSNDVNEYLREAAGEEFSAKDFRTWGGTVWAAAVLAQLGAPQSAAEAQRNVVEAVKHVAGRLRNRPATCRKYYIHPGLLTAYAAGELNEQIGAASLDPLRQRTDGRLNAIERATLALIEKYPVADSLTQETQRCIRKRKSAAR